MSTDPDPLATPIGFADETFAKVGYPEVEISKFKNDGMPFLSGSGIGTLRVYAENNENHSVHKTAEKFGIPEYDVMVAINFELWIRDQKHIRRDWTGIKNKRRSIFSKLVRMPSTLWDGWLWNRNRGLSLFRMTRELLNLAWGGVDL